MGAGHDRAEFAQKQHLGDLSRLIGLLPEPDALGVAAAENLGHNLPQVSCGEDFTLLQKRRDLTASIHKCFSARFDIRTWRGGDDLGMRDDIHRRMLQE
uniref:Uncharacterized protein n=1 Tax=Rhizobium leguminosarum TaxID=384 RepID=A0A179BZA1_RHILE|nr:hypothetical protein A4U53_37275 [Rhizobium leguminosarum]